MEIVRLGEVCTILNGFAFKSEDYSNSGIPLLRISNFDNGNVFIDDKTIYINQDYLSTKSEFVVEKGDILIALSGATTGKYGIYNFEFPSLLNQRIGLIKAGGSNLLYSKYFFHYLSILRIEILNNAGGAAQPNISTKKIGDLKIPLPPLDTQKRIATLLDTADSLRQKDKAVLQKYDALAQSLFLELFGDPVRNEKGWEKKKLSAVGKLDRGKSKHRPRNAPELLNGPYPLIQTGDVANAKSYIKEYKSTYSEIGLKQSKLWTKGTLCITIAANIAKTGILTFDACFPDSVVGFIPNEQTNTDFVQHWISFLQKMLEDSAPESAQKNINLGILKELEIICPPIELQNQFAEQIQLIEKQKALVQENLKKSEDLFMGLLGESFG